MVFFVSFLGCSVTGWRYCLKKNSGQLNFALYGTFKKKSAPFLKKHNPLSTLTLAPGSAPKLRQSPLSSSDASGRCLRSTFFSKIRLQRGADLVMLPSSLPPHISPVHPPTLGKRPRRLCLGWLAGSVQEPDRIFLFARRRGCLSISATSGGGLSGLLITMFSPASLPSLTGCITGKWKSRLGLSSHRSQLVHHYFL